MCARPTPQSVLKPSHARSIVKYLRPIKGIPVFEKDRLNKETQELVKLLLKEEERERQRKAPHIKALEEEAKKHGVRVYPCTRVGECLEKDYIVQYFEGGSLKQVRDIAGRVSLEDTAAMGGAAHPPFVSYQTRDSKYTVVLYSTEHKPKDTKRVEYTEEVLKDAVARSIALLAAHVLDQRRLWRVLGGVQEYDLVCMVASFLCSHPLVQGNCIQAEGNLGVLVLEFFQMYGKELNWTVAGIVPRTGSFAPRSQRTAHVHLCVFERDRVRLQSTNVFLYTHVQELFEHMHSGMALLLRENPEHPIVSFWVPEEKTNRKLLLI
ncbi:hypothetical protein NECID01_0028 [Nematocida sp. AWRm77]|nr:hypothetical protein NECID01_0028 [Nematocida sp. AWRm77]